MHATVGIVLIAQALGGEQHARPDERREVTEDILLPLRIGQLRGHPLDNAAPLHDFAQHHSTGVPGQPLGPALDAQGPVERRGDRLSRITNGVVRKMLSDFV